jgi:hypothetical protein
MRKLEILAIVFFILFTPALQSQVKANESLPPAVPAVSPVAVVPVAPTAPVAAAVPAATANVYFYRLRAAYGSVLRPSIFCDGVQVVRMRNGRFTSASFPIGTHNITSNFPGNGMALDMKAGETYYVRLAVMPASLFHGGKGAVTPVDPSQGKFEVAQLKPVEPEDLKPDTATP